MAPRVKESDSSKSAPVSNHVKSLELAKLREIIPKQAFEKSLTKSFFYMFFDMSMWLVLTFAMSELCDTEMWNKMGLVLQTIVALVYWNLTGFFLWCMFVVGHDCGHGTFSNSELLNDVCGHILHGCLMVPFYPWQLSHRRHHMYHNHVDKDYSFPWYTEDNLKINKVNALFNRNRFVMLPLPFIGWAMYLIGFPDGSHFLPIPFQKLWAETEKIDYFKCLFSTMTVLAFAATVGYFNSFSLGKIAFYYGASWIGFSWWLTTVTYLQHHGPETTSYKEGEWKFVDAAFETVDRKFGYGIDNLHHNITDGHVVHHLFFTKIPHYNLMLATRALQKHMVDSKMDHLYRFEKTYDFMIRIFYYMYTFGWMSHTVEKRAHVKSQ